MPFQPRPQLVGTRPTSCCARSECERQIFRRVGSRLLALPAAWLGLRNAQHRLAESLSRGDECGIRPIGSTLSGFR
jgi:hypothetical protein